MRLIPASTARSKTRRASSSEDVTPFRLVCDAPNVIAPSESALTRNPEAPSLRNSTDDLLNRTAVEYHIDILDLICQIRRRHDRLIGELTEAVVLQFRSAHASKAGRGNLSR